MARHGRILDWAEESQYYVEPKRLAKARLPAGAQGAGEDARAYCYSLTDKSEEALRQYTRTPGL
jgi:hypothetical protein